MRRIALLGCALGLALAGCGAGTPDEAATQVEPAPASRLGAMREESAGGGFERALEPRELVFPRDHGPHPRFRHEWWYFTGHLDAAGGARFGFELTFFRFALAPPDARDVAEGPSKWRTRQVYMAHFAVTDVERGRFRFAERLARGGALGLAGAQGEPLRVWVEDWSLDAQEGEAAGRWTLRAADADYGLTLELEALQPPVLNGENGLSRKSGEPGAASYYYSIPRLAARGRLVRGGETFDVEGLVWLDREWGSGALAEEQEGWDWFALQLDDGGSLMFYALRRRDGSRDPHSAGTWIAPDGSTRPLASADVRLDVRGHWESPRGGRYPARWRLAVPAIGLDVDVRPVLADQELGTDPRYWEGAVDVAGTRDGAKIAGRGYVELVGYAR